jgi:hypothetical protein
LARLKGLLETIEQMGDGEGAGHALLGNAQIANRALGSGLLMLRRCNEIIMPTYDIVGCWKILR